MRKLSYKDEEKLFYLLSLDISLSFFLLYECVCITRFLCGTPLASFIFFYALSLRGANRLPSLATLIMRLVGSRAGISRSLFRSALFYIA